VDSCWRCSSRRARSASSPRARARIVEGQKEIRRQEVDRAVVAAFAGWQSPPLTRTLDALLAEDPRLDLVRVTMVLGLYEAGRFDQVLAHPMEKVLGDAQAALKRVRAASFEKLEKSTEAAAERAALDRPEHQAGPLEHFALGVLEEAKRSEDPTSLRNAWDHFRTARLLAPRAEFVFHYRCAIAAMAAGETDVALESANALVRCGRIPPTRGSRSGTVRGRAAGAQLALEALERAVALEPNFPEAWLNIGVSHLILGDTASADAAYRRGLEAVRGNRAPWHLPALWGRAFVRGEDVRRRRRRARGRRGAQRGLDPETKMLASSLRKAGRILKRFRWRSASSSATRGTKTVRNCSVSRSNRRARSISRSPNANAVSASHPTTPRRRRCSNAYARKRRRNRDVVGVRALLTASTEWWSSRPRRNPG
jgi:tetratricopeptide (TPR) repeat protein